MKVKLIVALIVCLMLLVGCNNQDYSQAYYDDIISRMDEIEDKIDDLSSEIYDTYKMASDANDHAMSAEDSAFNVQLILEKYLGIE
jgi:outer membrane murein-binding lipoprotein Lpp